jgi:hypothetical protein
VGSQKLSQVTTGEGFSRKTLVNLRDREGVVVSGKNDERREGRRLKPPLGKLTVAKAPGEWPGGPLPPLTVSARLCPSLTVISGGGMPSSKVL